MHERRDNVLGTDVLGNFRLALECANLNFPTLETFEMALMRSFKLLLTEVLALTKMNVNNCTFADGVPITLSFSQKIGDIMKHIPEDGKVQPTYKFYM